MKTPISVYALCHSNHKEGLKIYSELYSLLCRDVRNPFTDGLDIPVYFITGDENQITEYIPSNAKKKVFLLFIDINMLCSEKWVSYINNLIDEVDSNTLIVGVKQHRYAFCINRKLSEIQSIVVNAEKDKEHIFLFEDDNWEHFITQLFDMLIRFVSGKGDKESLSIFISHSKRDIANKGELMAQDVRQFLYSDTKLNSFFDVHDILDGYKFGDQIKSKVDGSSLLILFTDTYSSREWCRIEALTAKEKQVPTVAVFMLEGKIDRLFPYMGNIPSITFEGDWRKVINLLLRTTLDQYVEKNMLMDECDEKTEILPYPPEAYNMSLLSDKTTRILYPEPPLGNEELDVLKSICMKMNRNVNFCTPMSYLTENINLKEKNIAISISESVDLPNLGIREEMFRDLIIELSRHILKANGRLLYGGNLTKGGYTELLKEMSSQYGQREKEEHDVFYIKNYLHWPIFNDVTLDQKANYISSRINLVSADLGDRVNWNEASLYIPYSSIENRLKWASSLTKMREQMADDAVARIIVGGKTQNFKGYMAGIAEECQIALKKRQPVFIIGGFGGVAHFLVDIFEKKADSALLRDTALTIDSYKEIYQWCEYNNHHIDYEYFDKVTLDDLNNGLSKEDNWKLSHSVDIIEIVSLILKGLSNKIK